MLQDLLESAQWYVYMDWRNFCNQKFDKVYLNLCPKACGQLI